MHGLQIWLLPFILFILATVIAFPLSRYIAWIMEGRYRAPPLFSWFERKLNSGPQNWKQYATSLLVFNTLLFVWNYAVLALQPWLPLNPDHKTLLSPTTIFHSAVSFMTNTDLQHYAGETFLSNFSQIFFCIANLFLSAAIGLSALMAIIRALRGESMVGNFFVDMWRGVVYLFLPLAFVVALLFISQGCPMTYASSVQAMPLDPASKAQTIVVGPVAAFESMKMLGTNGGGFYNMNSAHPFENPTWFSNILNTLSMMLIPFALPLVYGLMLGRKRHGQVLFCTVLAFAIGTVIWSVGFDTLQPNIGLTARPEATYGTISVAAHEALPVDQHLGNLEGKELRFGKSAGATFAALTTDFTCGAVNAEADSLNPLASLAPFLGMWMNCFFGGKGVGVINLLLYVIVGIFIAGMMVGRTPEYLGRKIAMREIKLVIIALAVHPLLILLPAGLFVGTHWGVDAISNPGAHGLSQIVYQFSSASANNGSAFDGLQMTYGFYNATSPAATAVAWDIATGLVIVFSRFLPILAPMAMAASLGAKMASPAGLGTLRDDTPTFALLLAGTLVVVGALVFFPTAALGPIAEHFGPIPFGGSR